MSEKITVKMTELLQELTKLAMQEAIKVSWEDSEEELMERFKCLIATPNDEMSPGPFAVMQTVGLVGTVLVMKHRKNEDELMRLLKESNVNFVKEIVSE